jgi:hypothetical protein
MIKLYKEIFTDGTEESVFDISLYKFPLYFKKAHKDAYKIVDEITEDDRYYRKVNMKKEVFFHNIPESIVELMPAELITAISDLLEETIFYKSTKKIKFSLSTINEELFMLSANIKLVSFENNKCKLLFMIYLDIHNMEKYISNPQLRQMMMSLLEKHIPNLLIQHIKEIYEECANL